MSESPCPHYHPDRGHL